MADPLILFESADLRVRLVAGRSRLCVVSFDSYVNVPTLDRPGFGEAFLAGCGIDAIHVQTRDNRWYHHAELDAALAAVAEAGARYERVVTYGSSMGGYAALRFATAAGAQAALAISPQYSIDPRVAPFETRWPAEAARLAFGTHPAPAGEGVVVYDPVDRRDRRHAELYAAANPRLILLTVPYAGHPATALLAETGQLQAMIRHVAEGRFDAARSRAALRVARRGSQHYLFTLALAARDRHAGVAIALLRRAAAIAREPHILSILARELDRGGEHPEAGRLHAEAQAPGNAYAALGYARHLATVGDHRAAQAVLRGAAADAAGTPRRLLRGMRWKLRFERLGLGRLWSAVLALHRRNPRVPETRPARRS